jgi:hypothetical protein
LGKIWGVNKLVAGVIITVMAGLILAMTGWNFSETAAAPSRYADKAANRSDHETINRKLDETKDLVHEKQEQIMIEIKEVQRLIIKLHTQKGD